MAAGTYLNHKKSLKMSQKSLVKQLRREVKGSAVDPHMMLK